MYFWIRISQHVLFKPQNIIIGITFNVLDGKTSIIIPVEGEADTFVVTIDRKLVKITWDGVSDKILNVNVLGEVENEPETKNNRFNDGKADPTGRLWVGTLTEEVEPLKFPKANGNLYSYQSGKGFKQHVGGISISNGLAWNRDLKKFYYIDTLTFQDSEFDYDEVNGTICK